MLIAPLSAFASMPERNDSSFYDSYSYIRFLRENELIDITDEEFFDLAGKVIFPVNKYTLPKNDSLLMELDKNVIPRINEDSLTLKYLMIRGAASPEGPFRWNKFLGEHRAKALYDFINARLAIPADPDNFNMEVDIEDYKSLCLMLRRAGDRDYGFVQALCDEYLPKKQFAELKQKLKSARQGKMWRRMLRDYFPHLRAARLILFLYDATKKYEKNEKKDVSVLDNLPVKPEFPTTIELPDFSQPLHIRLPRRELLSVKSNLLYDLAYMPGYDRWCPIPNIAIEYYPLHGHFTFGASLDIPWWQHYNEHKYFQIRNWQVESRYYLRSGDIANNPVGEGAAFRGLYLQGYVHGGIFGICFDADRGWVGEGFGAGVGAGYVMPLTKDGHWRLEFGAQVGFFTCKYDPYQYENPVDPNYIDHLYYYKWTLSPDLFKKRQYRFNWLGPTRIGVTLSYDLLYRRNTGGISFNPIEPSYTR